MIKHRITSCRSKDKCDFDGAWRFLDEGNELFPSLFRSGKGPPRSWALDRLAYGRPCAELEHHRAPYHTNFAICLNGTYSVKFGDLMIASVAWQLHQTCDLINSGFIYLALKTVDTEFIGGGRLDCGRGATHFLGGSPQHMALFLFRHHEVWASSLSILLLVFEQNPLETPVLKSLLRIDLLPELTRKILPRDTNNVDHNIPCTANTS